LDLKETDCGDLYWIHLGEKRISSEHDNENLASIKGRKFLYQLRLSDYWLLRNGSAMLSCC
jgi:hypothetical protein